MDLLGSRLPLPIVKLSELDDSVCNRIQPLNIFQCEVYQTVLNNSILAWYVNINGIEKTLTFLENELGDTGYSLKKENVSEFELTASTHIVRNKTHCTEPILVSTLIVHPPTSSINITKPFNVTCDIHHTSILHRPINVTTTHHDLTGI